MAVFPLCKYENIAGQMKSRGRRLWKKVYVKRPDALSLKLQPLHSHPKALSNTDMLSDDHFLISS